MIEGPALKVRFLLNIERKQGDTSLSSEIVKRFVRDFRKYQWPGEPWPDLYYDPRALAEIAKEKAVIHAKCIIADRNVAFVSSANFTEAAQEKNIEVGMLVHEPDQVGSLRDYFEDLIAQGKLTRVEWG
jgi:phosphatidylserine/phosphatidylglycerophosphate/cardiolipin synthase-like enzyme